MPPKLQFVHRLIFSTQLDSWLLMHMGSPEGREKENQVIQVNEMKVQVPDFTENLTQFERDPFHFLTSLTRKRNYARKTVSFLTSLTQEENHAHETVSFFNELDTGREPCS